LQIDILAVGKLKESYWREAQAEYVKRLSRFAQPHVVEVSEERLPDNASAAMEAQGREKEGERLLQALPRNGVVVVLDLSGKQLESPELAEKFRAWTLSGQSTFSFIIGGSTGLSSAVMRAADFRLCLSKMTFPHQLARILLLEQLYRAMKINGNETYHK